MASMDSNFCWTDRFRRFCRPYPIVKKKNGEAVIVELNVEYPDGTVRPIDEVRPIRWRDD